MKFLQELVRLIKFVQGYLYTDVIIVSFPKSGRTWLRQLLGHCLVQQFNLDEEPSKVFNWTKKYSEVPSIWAIHQIRFLEFFLLRNKKYIFLVRNPKDVVVSHYHWKIHRENSPDRGLSCFIRDEKAGINSIIHYIDSWVERFTKFKTDICVISYEQLHDTPSIVLKRIATFMGITLNDAVLAAAIEASSFKKMKEEELAGKYSLKSEEMHNTNAFKVRKGKVGSYKSEMSEEDLNYVDEVIQKNLDSRLSKLFSIKYTVSES